ncbi:hypothetical protein DZI87_05865 [Escherichia coli]|nr:hypothetical protein [Escherichia coli]EFO0584372.1 hypothetical protein [Escherichia coli]GCG86122.1 hypothetical protein BvCmsI113A_01757 [Escherichia coli]
MNVFKSHRRLTLPEQYHGLCAQYPDGECKIIGKNNTLVWEGILRPTPFSREYRVRLKYAPPSAPHCYVVSPELKILSSGKKIPHTYASSPLSKITQLCLFLPKERHPDKFAEWMPQYQLSETILPWASLWLFYFEQWLHSGVWEGGGAHPNDDDDGVYYEEIPRPRIDSRGRRKY